MSRRLKILLTPEQQVTPGAWTRLKSWFKKLLPIGRKAARDLANAELQRRKAVAREAVASAAIRNYQVIQEGAKAANDIIALYERLNATVAQKPELGDVARQLRLKLDELLANGGSIAFYDPEEPGDDAVDEAT